MIDVAREVQAIEREVGTGQTAAGEGRTVTLRRTYNAPIDDVWDALTNPDRIGRWFLPISGDLRLGGRYQFEGNAGGTIQECDRPNRLRVTWAYMDTGNPADISEVEVRLTPVGDGQTQFEMVHTAIVPEEMWQQFGPGAVGVGWDGGFLGLSLHLTDPGAFPENRETWPFTDEGREFYRLSSDAWGEANRAAGAPADVVAHNVANTLAFYTTDPTATEPAS